MMNENFSKSNLFRLADVDRRQILAINDKLIDFKNQISKVHYSSYKDKVANTGEEVSLLLYKLLFAENSVLRNKKQLGSIISFLSLNCHNYRNLNTESIKLYNIRIYPKGENATARGYQNFYNKLASKESGEYIVMGKSILYNTCIFNNKNVTNETIKDFVNTTFILPMGIIYSISNLQPPYKIKTDLSSYLNQSISKDFNC